MKRRNTRQTLLVTEILEKSRYPVSQKDILKKIKSEVDRVTIYRIINRLIKDGKVHRVISDNGETFFAYCDLKNKNQHQMSNHIHFKCIKCKKIICLNRQIRYSLPKGFLLLETNYFISGYCKNCNH